MTGILFLLLSAAGFTAVLCGAAAELRGRVRRGLRLFVAGNGTLAVGAIVGRDWPLAVGNLAVAVVAALLLWHLRRRKRRASRAYGAKSWARIVVLTRKARDATRPRPVRRLQPQGTGGR